jgi:hypothetical protein
VSFSLDWPLSTLLVITGVLTFALLGCSLRRMRSRDRVTVVVWWVGCTLTAGAGLWATWAFGLASLTPPPPLPPLPFLPWRLALLAVGAAMTVVLLHFVARLHGSELRRVALQTLLLAGLWAGMFEVARRSVAGSVLVLEKTRDLPTLPVVTALVALGCAIALWIQSNNRWSDVPRVWISGAVLGGTHAAAMIIGLSALRSSPVAASWPTALPVGFPSDGVGIGIGTLMFACGLSLMLVLVGLICSWLDTHAHVRNRLLSTSLNDANRRLRDQAHSDPLTRMPNRLMFEERMKAALATAARSPCCSSTWTASSPSTTRSATSPATRYCARSAPG